MNTQPFIVYAEDDELSILAMKMVIEKVMKLQNLTVFHSSGKFMDKLNQLGTIPDLFLLDIQMKPYDGFELLGMLKNDGRFQKSKIIALTASVMSEEVERLKQAGFHGAIAKPLDIPAFPGLIYGILKGESIWYIS